MSYSKTTLIRRIRDRAGEQAWYDICTSAPNTVVTTLTVADTTKWAVGDIGEFQDDGERVKVTALTNATTLTVTRGFMSDTPATGTSHAANQYLVKRPVLAFNRIAEAVSTVIDDLWPHVYASVTADIVPLAGTYFYSVPATWEFLVDAEQLSTSTTANVFRYGGIRSEHPIDLLKNLADNVPVAGTTGKVVYVPVYWNQTNTIRVTAARRLTDAVSGGNYSDLSAGVEVSCVIYLALADLLEGADLGRLLNRDNSMYDQSVVPGRRSQVADNVWHKKGIRYRRQWTDDLRQRLPRMQTYRQAMP